MSRPPRLKDFDYKGKHRYFLTICSHDRRPHFADADIVNMFALELQRTSAEFAIAIPAYCAMPDHVHLLAVGGSTAADLRKFVEKLKQQTGWCFRRDRSARLWQEGYYDHVLRPEEGTASVLAYIVGNPARDGLVADPWDYPHWGSFTHTRDEIVALITGAAAWKPGDL